MAKTPTPYSSTSAAATSSCVDSGLDAQRTTSAPPALSVRARFAVSVVTCRHAEMRCPASGCSFSKRSRIAASTGICRSAQAIRRTPSGASAKSFTSYRCVVAMNPLFDLVGCQVSGRVDGEQPLVLALLPVDPGGGSLLGLRDARPGEPRLDRRSERRLAPQPQRELELSELDAEARPELGERVELVQLTDAVPAVARRAPRRDDEPLLLEVPKHARRPTRAAAGLPDRHHRLHDPTLSESCQCCWSGGPRRGTGVEWTIEVVVSPCGVKRSRISSSSSIERRCSRRR